MNFFIFTVACFATFRLALMVSQETGPMRIFAKLRKAPKPHSNLREGISCPWCVSVHISALVTTFLWWLGFFPGQEWPLYWLAISGGAVACNQLFIASKS